MPGFVNLFEGIGNGPVSFSGGFSSEDFEFISCPYSGVNVSSGFVIVLHVISVPLVDHSVLRYSHASVLCHGAVDGIVRSLSHPLVLHEPLPPWVLILFYSIFLLGFASGLPSSLIVECIFDSSFSCHCVASYL